MTIIDLSDYRPYTVYGVEIEIWDDHFMGKMPEEEHFSIIGSVDMTDEEFLRRINSIKSMYERLTSNW